MSNESEPQMPKAPKLPPLDADEFAAQNNARPDEPRPLYHGSTLFPGASRLPNDDTIGHEPEASATNYINN